jgi:hypothetical protein
MANAGGTPQTDHREPDDTTWAALPGLWRRGGRAGDLLILDVGNGRIRMVAG